MNINGRSPNQYAGYREGDTETEPVQVGFWHPTRCWCEAFRCRQHFCTENNPASRLNTRAAVTSKLRWSNNRVATGKYTGLVPWNMNIELWARCFQLQIWLPSIWRIFLWSAIWRMQFLPFFSKVEIEKFVWYRGGDWRR